MTVVPEWRNTEQQAEAAIKYLRRIIDAAENGNQDGENAVVIAAREHEMETALHSIMSEAVYAIRFRGDAA